jgi:hypothetical protein
MAESADTLLPVKNHDSHRERSTNTTCFTDYFRAGLPDFLGTKPEKMYQLNTKCTKWS